MKDVLPVQVMRAYVAHFGKKMDCSFPEAQKRLSEALGIIEAVRLVRSQLKKPRATLADA